MASTRETSREIERVGIASSGRSERQRPERPVRNHGAGCVLELGDEGSVGIECIDSPIAKIADQDVVAEHTEVGRSLCDSPRRVQSAGGSEAIDEVSIQVEHADI